MSNSYIITKFREAGFTNKWYYDIQDAIVNNKRKHQITSNEAKSFTLDNLIFSFYLLAIGLTISFLVLIFEFSCTKRKKKKKR